MTDIPMLFTSPMVNALLNGRKTMTRRVITRLKGFGKVTEFGPSDTHGFDWHFRDKEMRWHDLTHAQMMAALPWQVGDRIWVKEAWQAWSDMDHLKPSEITMDRRDILFTADRPDHPWDSRKRNARFMPRRLSRLTLPVTGVKIERLQDISDADALNEGVSPQIGDLDPVTTAWFRGYPRRAFSDLWQDLNGKSPLECWDANPWVIAIAFDVDERNIGEGGA